jgi:hypothetical protein
VRWGLECLYVLGDSRMLPRLLDLAIAAASHAKTRKQGRTYRASSEIQLAAVVIFNLFFF